MKKVLLLGLLLALSAWPADYTDAKTLVAALQDKIKTVHDYQMVAYTESGQRKLVIDYRCVRPSDIRTEVLDGPHRGAVILYQPGVKDKMVKIKAGNKRVWRSIQKLKLADTPLVVSVLDRFSQDLSEYQYTLRPSQQVQVDVGRPVSEAPPADDPLARDDDLNTASTAGLPTVPRQRLQKECYILTGTHGPDHEEVAIDKATLLPVSVKRFEAGKPDFVAQVWSLQLNVSPHIEL